MDPQVRIVASDNPEFEPGLNLAEILELEQGLANPGTHLCFLFIKTTFKSAPVVADAVARLKSHNPAWDVRWTVELINPETTVLAAAVVPSLQEMADLVKYIKEGNPDVLNPTAVQVAGGAYYDGRDNGRRKAHNGWP
jgi:hypothetical protein